MEQTCCFSKLHRGLILTFLQRFTNMSTAVWQDSTSGTFARQWEVMIIVKTRAAALSLLKSLVTVSNDFRVCVKYIM